MKNIFLITLFILISTTLISLADDVKFINALKNCSSYSETRNINTEGMNVNSHKQILGWENDRCVYKEKVNFSGTDSCMVCKFNKSQINEIVNVMKAYNTVQMYSPQEIDTSSYEAVKNNPVVKVWGKYLQDSSVCTLTTN